MITVKDWMSKPVVTIKPDMMIVEVAKMMAKQNIGCVIISSDGKKPEGILTERDLVKFMAEGKDPLKIMVKAVMIKKVVTIKGDSSLLEVSKLMSKNQVRRIVVMEGGQIAGIITSKDLLQVMAG